MTKDESLRLIAEDPDVRAAVQALLLPVPPTQMLAEAPVLAPVFQGPGWLAHKAAEPTAGPHTRSRVRPPEGAQ